MTRGTHAQKQGANTPQSAGACNLHHPFATKGFTLEKNATARKAVESFGGGALQRQLSQPAFCQLVGASYGNRAKGISAEPYSNLDSNKQ